METPPDPVYHIGYEYFRHIASTKGPNFGPVHAIFTFSADPDRIPVGIFAGFGPANPRFLPRNANLPSAYHNPAEANGIWSRMNQKPVLPDTPARGTQARRQNFAFPIWTRHTRVFRPVSIFESHWQNARGFQIHDGNGNRPIRRFHSLPGTEKQISSADNRYPHPASFAACG
ncbi:MAG: hypothetical protein PHW69_08830 [Elusimicrobiaceae bacterium]|nr:hypothetical protein [Elusimicrobiaceae bacterium]